MSRLKGRLTIAMAMVLDSHTENLEAVHANRSGFDSLLTLEYHVNRSGKKANEGIAHIKRPLRSALAGYLLILRLDFEKTMEYSV